MGYFIEEKDFIQRNAGTMDIFEDVNDFDIDSVHFSCKGFFFSKTDGDIINFD